MSTELNDPRAVEDIVDRWCRRLMSDIDNHIDNLKKAVSRWEPRPCPPTVPYARPERLRWR